MLQQEEPDDYVLATGELHSVRECVELSAEYLGYDIEWRGTGIDEKGYDKKSGKLLVEIDPDYFRPSEVDLLLGDATKAKEKLGWEPKIKFKELITEITESDFQQMKNTGKIE
jgi:GDPmannose 4,6-dehydratase